MKNTRIHPDGECEVTDFEDVAEGVPESTRYLWTAADGWRQWIVKEDVENGGYWRKVANDALVTELTILQQQAMGALARRRKQDDNTGGSEQQLP